MFNFSWLPTKMICRACLLISNTKSGLPRTFMKNLNEYLYDDITYTEMYEHCVGINILSEVNKPLDLPTFICETCEKNLLMCFEFRRKCWATENKLKSGDFDLTHLKSDDASDVETDYSTDSEEVSQGEEMFYAEEINLYDSNVIVKQSENCKSTLKTEQVEEGVEEYIQEIVTKEETLSETPHSATTKRKRAAKVCPVCGKSIRYKYAFHVASHEKIPYENRPYACTECDKRFRHKEYLKGHMNTHTKELRYPCPHCDRKFQAWISRKAHVARCHTGEYRFECTACSTTFWTKHQYNEHMRRHSGLRKERKMECSLCDKRLVDKRHLREHMLVHSAERNEKCPECDKSYKSKKNLIVHIKNHHPYILQTTKSS